MDERDWGEDGVFPAKNLRDLKQTTLATATRTRKKKDLIGRTKAHFVHFLAVPCKTAT